MSEHSDGQIRPALTPDGERDRRTASTAWAYVADLALGCATMLVLLALAVWALTPATGEGSGTWASVGGPVLLAVAVLLIVAVACRIRVLRDA